MSIVLEVIGLAKHYKNIVAVNNIGIKVVEGEVFGFLGPNGSGKTTTIGMILGLLRADAGQVEVLGRVVSPKDNGALASVGALVGTPGFVPYLTGRANLEHWSKLRHGVSSERIAAVLELVGLTQAADRRVSGYSLGMKQRLGLGGALLHQPKLLILDEPTNGLDPAGIRDMRDLLRQLPSQGTTVFLSSHNLHEVEQICDRVAVLNQGQVVFTGRVSELSSPAPAVRIRVADPDRAMHVVRDFVSTSATVQTDYLEVNGADVDDVVATLVKNGIVPLELLRSGRSLESVYLELTKGR